MTTPIRTSTRCLATALLALVGWQTHAQLFGPNLILNGDAEADAGRTDRSTSPVVTSWDRPGLLTDNNHFSVVQYGTVTVDGDFPSAATPRPAFPGSNFFSGGPNAAVSLAVQTLDISAGAGQIDSGSVLFNLAGYFGGFAEQRDAATLTVQFKSGLVTLGSSSVGPVTVADRGDATGLWYREATGTVPAGTRELRFVLQMDRQDGDYDDGYADNLSFTMTAVPEPGAMTLCCAMSLAGIVLFRRFALPR